MKLTESVKPISYLKANAAKLIRDVFADGKAFVITQYGEAKAILVDVPSYEALQESVALLKMLAQSQESIRKKRAKPLKKAFADVRRSLRRSTNQNEEA